MYYKNKTKAYERQPQIFGSYTRGIGDDVNGHYYYQSNFANENFGMWFCGDNWFIGIHSDKGKCRGYAYPLFHTDQCVHDIGFDWKYSGASDWENAGKGLAVKCLYEPGNCLYSFITKLFSFKKYKL